MPADTAPQIHYRDEYIQGFEQRATLLRKTVTTEAVVKGLQATFLVADSGGATPKTRGMNGKIPTRTDNLSQVTATLVEAHDVVEKTGFNVFTSQGDQRRIMQVESMGVTNRGIDQRILTALSAATTTVTIGVADLFQVTRLKTILGNNDVPFDGLISAIISPAMEGYLMQVKEFASAEYVTRKPIVNADLAWNDQPTFFRWMGINWITHPNLSGAGTAAEICYMYHRSAIGHAVSTADIQVEMDYDRKDDLSWVRHTIYHEAKLLQNSGVLKISHDGSALSA